MNGGLRCRLHCVFNSFVCRHGLFSTNVIKGWSRSIDCEVVDKNRPFSGVSNRTEAKKDQYLDRNDYNAHDRTRISSLALIKREEQDAIFDGILLPGLFSELSCHNKVQFFSRIVFDWIESDIELCGSTFCMPRANSHWIGIAHFRITIRSRSHWTRSHVYFCCASIPER